MTFHKCIRCGHQSLKAIDETEVIGVTQCVKGNKAVMNRRQYGTKCLLCIYGNLRMEVTDSKGHRVA